MCPAGKQKASHGSHDLVTLSMNIHNTNQTKIIEKNACIGWLWTGLHFGSKKTEFLDKSSKTIDILTEV